nr:four helix bundle protein [Lusitaniella coriacea]
MHKFTLGDRIINRLYDLLEGLLYAKYARQKLSLLTPLNTQLDLLRYQTRLLNALPKTVQRTADQCYDLLKANPNHPSLHFKKVDKYWSVRAGKGHRALGYSLSKPPLPKSLSQAWARDF